MGLQFDFKKPFNVISNLYFSNQVLLCKITPRHDDHKLIYNFKHKYELN